VSFGEVHLGSGTGEFPNLEEGEGRVGGVRDVIVREETTEALFQ
jgi:hypothetical protein